MNVRWNVKDILELEEIISCHPSDYFEDFFWWWTEEVAPNQTNVHQRVDSRSKDEDFYLNSLGNNIKKPKMFVEQIAHFNIGFCDKWKLFIIFTQITNWLLKVVKKKRIFKCFPTFITRHISTIFLNKRS